MQLGTLSSNWKTLQKTLKSGNAQGSDSRKRKATNDPTAANPHGLDGVKKPKIRSAPAQRRTARRNMIADNLATEASEGLSTTPGSQRAPDNDISNVAMARASTTSTRLVHSDKPNEGLNKSLSSQLGKYLALDCEMVGVGGPGTAERSVLARASIVDWHGRQVYDSYVRPREPVTDWRTAVSGVGMWHMKEAREFEEVQRDVADLLEGRILVGHAVRHDLAALLLPHPQRDIRDTARHPAFRKLSAGRTPALKRLAQEMLGLEIQGGQHSSIEDARACMSLFRVHKDAFEVEHTRHYPLQPAPADKGDTLAEGGNRTKKRKKKKMKGKR